jgi:hypothetical protein
MIKSNDSITIEKVSNGFIIRTEVRQHEMASLNEIAVCNTTSQLNKFIREHFTEKTSNE